MLLRLDPERPLGQGRAYDFRPVGEAQRRDGVIDAARDSLTEAREIARSVGYTSIFLRASIYLSVALNQSGDMPGALKLVHEARNAARQQGFDGLEAEALLCEAVIAPPVSEENKATIIHNLTASIAISSRNDARPLLLKAETVGDQRDLAEGLEQTARTVGWTAPLARGRGLRKIVAQMTPDQKGAMATFERLGFRPEALLQDFVVDHSGRTRDLVVMAFDVTGLTEHVD